MKDIEFQMKEAADNLQFELAAALRDKLFRIHGKFSETPHLAINHKVPENESVEEKLAGIRSFDAAQDDSNDDDIPEIKDIEEVIDSAPNEQSLDDDNEQEDEEKITKVELPGFSDEDSIVGMPRNEK